MSGQLHAPAALLLGKEPPVPTCYGAGWAPEPVWTRWRREKFPPLPLSGTEPRSHSLGVYSDCATAAPRTIPYVITYCTPKSSTRFVQLYRILNFRKSCTHFRRNSPWKFPVKSGL